MRSAVSRTRARTSSSRTPRFKAKPSSWNTDGAKSFVLQVLEHEADYTQIRQPLFLVAVRFTLEIKLALWVLRVPR